jgi:intein/homing endonuclease
MRNLDSAEFLINMKSIPEDETSEEYVPFWDNEYKKITEGVTINGFYFSPFIYWHLNYGTLYKDELVGARKVRRLGKPQLWDSYLKIDESIGNAENHADGMKGLVIVGSRRISKTIITSSYMAHKAVTQFGSDNLISALNQPDLSNTTQAVDLVLQNLPKYFRFLRIEDDWKRQVTLGFKDKTTNKRNAFSRIHVRNFDEGNNTEAAAGLTLSSFMLEEAGKGNMLNCLSATIPCFDSEFGWRCSPIVIGTSGDMTKAGDLEELFNNPEAYNFLSVEANETGKSYGLFIPGTKSLKVPREDKPLGLYLGKEESSELDNITIWVSDEEKGKEMILKNRENVKKASGLEAYLKEIMYYPLTHEECFMEMSQNIFPVDLLQEQLQKLVNNDIKGDNVELYFKQDGKVAHKFTDKKPVVNFPVKPADDIEGCVVIWEYPISDAPYGLYTAGCLPAGEKVLTDRGMMNIEDITMSEKLISKDGNLVDIYSLERYYLENSPNFEVKVSNTFRTTTFTEEHPIFINGDNLKPYQINSNTEFGFKEVKHLKVGDWIKVPNFYRNNAYTSLDLDQYWGVDFVRLDRRVASPINNSEFWWLIGYYLGDGWVTGSKVSFAVNSQETYYVEKLRCITEKYLDRSFNNFRTRNNAVEYTINCEELADFLVLNFRKYAEGKNIPEWVKYLPEEYKVELISGYLASDGCVTTHTKGYGSTEFVSISLELLEAFQDILFSLGIVSNLSKLRDKGETKFRDVVYNTKECYHLRMGNGSTINLIEKINDLLDSKIQKVDLNVLKSFGKQKRSGCFMNEDLSYIYFQVTDIKIKLFTGIVYNFHCETNTFMCHHISTHNTDPYKQSQAHYSTSLGSTYIYKRVHNLSGEGWQNIVVAAYTGRPKKIEQWYETTKMLLMYYNAKTLCENMDYGFIQHCVEKNIGPRVLERTPSFLTDIHPNSTVNRDYGIHMTREIKSHLLGLIIEYLTEEIDIERDADGNVVKTRLGVSRILDPLLLKELLKFTPKLNVDRIIAFGLTLAMSRTLANKITVHSNSEDDRLKEYFRSRKPYSPFRSSTSSPFRL